MSRWIFLILFLVSCRSENHHAEVTGGGHDGHTLVASGQSEDYRVRAMRARGQGCCDIFVDVKYSGNHTITFRVAEARLTSACGEARPAAQTLYEVTQFKSFAALDYDRNTLNKIHTMTAATEPEVSVGRGELVSLEYQYDYNWKKECLPYHFKLVALDGRTIQADFTAIK